MKKFVQAKFHGIYVTEAQLEYHGSITLDPEHCRELGILPLEYVDIWNKYSGARISTYVIYGQPGSCCCVLNGAAARTCQVGDQIIISSSVWAPTEQVTDLKPKVLTFNRDNTVKDRLEYDVREMKDWYDFDIIDTTRGMPLSQVG